MFFVLGQFCEEMCLGILTQGNHGTIGSLDQVVKILGNLFIDTSTQPNQKREKEVG